MTSYNYEGNSVLVKPPVQMGSALVESAVNPGDLLVQGSTDLNKVKVGTSGVPIGIAIEARASGDVRPVAFVKQGLVRIVSDGAATLAIGSRVQPSAATAGQVKGFVEGTTNEKLLVATVEGAANGDKSAVIPATAGTVFMAYVNIGSA